MSWDSPGTSRKLGLTGCPEEEEESVEESRVCGERIKELIHNTHIPRSYMPSTPPV